MDAEKMRIYNDMLNRIEEIKEAYLMLIPCIHNNAIQDYELVLTNAPNAISDLTNLIVMLKMKETEVK